MKETAKKLMPLAAASLTLCAGFVYLTAPGHATRKQKAPFMHRNFAHRGLHRQDKSVPENSLAAFERAAAAGYGIELDVQLSKDGEVVVFHDDTLNRVCSVDAKVCDKTLAELKDMSLCGTDETIPLFSEVLKCVHSRSPLIVELKNGKLNTELCEKTYALLKSYPGEYCIESFNPFIVRWFMRNAPKVVRGQLACPAEDYDGQVKGIEAFLLSNVLLNFLCRPQFIAYKIGPKPFPVRLSEILGAMKVAWTSHQWMTEKKNDAVIFEFYKPKLKYKKR